MKKHVMTLLAVLLFCNAGSFAQKRDSIVYLPSITVTANTKISQELGKAFQKSFSGAEYIRWYKMDENYLAKFIHHDMDHNALFKKNGYLKYDIGFGYEGNLPKEILHMVQSAYDNYKIVRAINVKTEGRNIWVVNLEGMKIYVIVRVEDRELEEVERFVKAG